MELLIDFKSDWHTLLNSVMTNSWGIKTDDLAEDLPIHYFNVLQRRIPSRPRQLLVSDTFVYPPGHAADWDEICRIVTKGEDLVPYLSKLIDLPERTDSMLNEWGVYHLHFRARPARTGPLVYARITDAKFFAIGVFDHKGWCADEVVETLHRNWPEEIDRWKILGMTATDITPSERKVLRSKNWNSFFLTKDGTSYGGIGGGMMASGHNSASVRMMDMQHDILEQLEKLLEESMSEILPHLINAGYSDQKSVLVRLVLNETDYQAYFPDYALLVAFQKRGQEQNVFHWPMIDA